MSDLRSLGRIVHHDPRSLNYPAAAADTLVTTLHARTVAPFDQGQIGSCTGNAMAGLLSTAPFSQQLTEDDALGLYELATTLDDQPGQYPPEDTGSSGLAVAKAAQEKGWISSYRHAFGLQHALGALVVSPVITGVSWYDSFDQPDATGLVTISPDASVRGGHEFELVGLDVDAQTVRACNSWGTGWGDGGYFTIGWADFERLLNEQGDVTVAA